MNAIQSISAGGTGKVQLSQQDALKNYFHAFGKKRVKKAGIPVTYQLHLLTSQLVIQECNLPERDGT